MRSDSDKSESDPNSFVDRENQEEDFSARLRASFARLRVQRLFEVLDALLAAERDPGMRTRGSARREKRRA